MGRGIVIGVLGVLALFVASSAAAEHADAATEVQRPTTEAFVYLGERRGYQISIGMPNPRVALLHVLKVEEVPAALESGSLNYVQSAYAVRVRSSALSRGVIRARFPSIGKVALRFKPSGERRVHRAQNNCRGKRRVTEYGTFRGTISLEGEDGYFRVKARGREGSLMRRPRLVCEKGEARQVARDDALWEYVAPGFEFSPFTTISVLYAVADEGGRYIGIRAARRGGRFSGAEVQLGTLEWRSGMPIGRLAVAADVPDILTTSAPGAHPASATLAPPPPFYGEGNYFENSATSHSWTGTLGVSLPGLELPLTGEEFKTSLCVIDPKKTPAGCDFIDPKPVVGARPALSWAGR